MFPNLPSNQETEHLAKLLGTLSRYPPFSYIQYLVSLILPFTGHAGKAGENTTNDLVNYLKGWHDKNDNLAQRIYVIEEKIPEVPFMPKAAVRASLMEQYAQAQPNKVTPIQPEQTAMVGGN